jgi:hypothetical protein
VGQTRSSPLSSTRKADFKEQQSAGSILTQSNLHAIWQLTPLNARLNEFHIAHKVPTCYISRP